jgi:hypothetical protein
MPKTKTTPAAEAPPIQPEPAQLTEQQKEEAEEQLRCQVLGELIATISELSRHKLWLIQTFEAIVERERGCTTPIEAFIESLVMHYGVTDKNGEGLTIEQIKFQMDQHIREQDVRDTLETAYFLTDRYPRPEPEQTSTQE